MGEAIGASTKAFDVAARYGGDEFVVLLPGCNASDAVGVADRVRAEIAQRVSDVPVTVSAGVATMPDNATDAERLVAAADGALYEAKRTRPRPHRASIRAAGRGRGGRSGCTGTPRSRAAPEPADGTGRRRRSESSQAGGQCHAMSQPPTQEPM